MAGTLTEIAPIEEWIKLALEICNRFGFHCVTYDRDNNALHPPPSWANGLCKLIKEHDEGSKYICAISQQNIAAEARQLRQPIIEECNGGFLKIVVPVFLGDEFVGSVGGCGLLGEEGEIDSFLIAKTLGRSEEEIKDLLGNAKRISTGEVETMVRYIETRLGEMSSKKA